MPLTSRVLSPEDVESFEQYLGSGGGRALRAARELTPDAVITLLEDSGLRARGGSGTPCGPKWRAVRSFGADAAVPPTVVVNAVDGEPGSFKDREILRRNPYRVLEGALIAMHAVGAGDLILATKLVHSDVRDRACRAIEEMRSAGWLDGIDVEIFDGPDEYLLGEETALLEAIDGRLPFPRIAPPHRRGVHEVADGSVAEAAMGASAAHVELAGPGTEAFGSATLVNNVETLANVPGIIDHGPAWFRSIGTAESPGSIVCTISGATQRDGVGEVPMGTPLREVIELIGGGALPGREIKAVIGTVATPALTGAMLDTPVSNEGMQGIGSHLGCGGFFVFDDHDDMAAVAAGIARFLAIESCGLCTPCKEDGLALAELFGRISRSSATEADLGTIADRLDTVDYGARCHLATQFKLVLQSILDDFDEELLAHVHGTAPAAEPELITTIVDIRGGRAALDTSHRSKQPDWTFDARWSGQSPADRHPELPRRMAHV